jgi:hypothetical protein
MVGIDLFGQQVAPWLIVLVDLRGQFPARALFGCDRAAARPLVTAAQDRWLLLPHRPAICRERAQAAEGRADQLRLVHGHGDPDLCRLGIGSGDRRDLRRADRGSRIARSRLPAADLFPRSRHELSQEPRLAAHRADQRGGSILAFVTVGSPWHVSIGAAAGIIYAVIRVPGRAGKAR